MATPSFSVTIAVPPGTGDHGSNYRTVLQRTTRPVAELLARTLIEQRQTDRVLIFTGGNLGKLVAEHNVY